MEKGGILIYVLIKKDVWNLMSEIGKLAILSNNNGTENPNRKVIHEWKE